MTTDNLIEELTRLEKEAAPGPWSAKRIDYEEYGIDVSFEINAPRKSPVLQTIMVERHEVASVRTDWANCKLVTALRNHLPAILSALKENKRLREALESSEEYFDGCADAEYFPDRAAPVPNEEMRLLQKIRAALQPQGEK